MWIVILIGVGFVVLAHTAPAPFVLDRMAADRAVWHMPRTAPPTIYLTYDDGPNPTTTPDLLDVLAREGVRATFFLIDRHITDETAAIVRRMFADGHAVALHSATRRHMLMAPDEFARTLTRAADRIEELAGTRPCRAYRPHAGWRSGQMYVGLRQIDYELIGWGWMLWDWNWFRQRTAQSVFDRVAGRVRSGDIIVMHDGDESAPRSDQRHTVDATARLVPALRARGFGFGRVCENDLPGGRTRSSEARDDAEAERAVTHTRRERPAFRETVPDGTIGSQARARAVDLDVDDVRHAVIVRV